MASKLLAVAAETGITTGKFVRFRKSDRAVWSTAGTPAFETYSAGNIANYGIAATEIGATGLYEATDPAEGTAGDWLFIKAAGASLAVSDVVSNVYYTGEASAWPSPLIIYVDKANGSDNNDGLTPKTAKATIAGSVAGTYGGALTVARAAGGKTLIKCAPTGAYIERNVIDLLSTASGTPPIDLDITGCTIRSMASWNARTGGGSGIVFTATSVTWAGGTATATFNTAGLSNYLKTGDSVVISGASQSGLNGTKTVTISNELQLTYSTGEAGSGTGTGTILFAITLAAAQIGSGITMATGSTVTAYNAVVYACPGQGTISTYGSAGIYANTIGCRGATHTPAKFYRVLGGTYIGDSDSFYDSSLWTPESPDGLEQKAYAEDAAFIARADAAVVNAASTHVIFRRCFISVYGPGTVDNFTTDSRALVGALGGRIDIYDSSILCQNATSKTYAVHAQGSNTSVNLYNTRLQSVSSSGTVLDINTEDTSVVRVHDCEYDASKTASTVNSSITVVPSHGADVRQAAGTNWNSGAIQAGTFASDAITAAKLASDAVTEIQSGLATAAALQIVDDLIDTEVAAIKAKTDQLTFTVAGQVDANTVAADESSIAAAVWASTFRTLTGPPAITSSGIRSDAREIVKGNDYDSTSQPILVPLPDGPTDLSEYTWTFTLSKDDDNANSGASSITGTVAIDTATGAGRQVRIDLTATNTATLAKGLYNGALRGTKTSNSKKWTPYFVAMTVLTDPNQA